MTKAFTISKVFLGFLVTSLLFWLLMNLSKEYVADINLEVSFQNIGQDMLVVNDPPKEIVLSVKASGFKLVGTNFIHKPIILNLQELIYKADSTYYLLSKKLKPEIQKQLKSGLTLNRVKVDSIFFKINKLYSKKVMISPELNINYKKGFDIATKKKLSPDSIIISGAKKIVESIKKIETEKLELKNISQDVSTKINLIIPEKIKTKYTSALLEFKVDKFTEGKLDLPISIINLPDTISINIFPKTVTLVYKVGLKNFNQIDASFFKVYCDYNDSQKNKLPYLVPKLKIKDNIASSVRMIPNKIDFLIHK